jgi:hypothetical protein
MTSPLITGYIAGLRRSLPAALADEAADGLTEAYEHHLAAGTADQEAAQAALAEFGDLPTVIAEFTRQSPARRAARLLLATGPAVGTCWAAAVIAGRAWTWPPPADQDLGLRDPADPRPGRDRGNGRARRARADIAAAHRRSRQPHPDRAHRPGTAPARRPVTPRAQAAARSVKRH